MIHLHHAQHLDLRIESQGHEKPEQTNPLTGMTSYDFVSLKHERIKRLALTLSEALDVKLCEGRGALVPAKETGRRFPVSIFYLPSPFSITRLAIRA